MKKNSSFTIQNLSKIINYFSPTQIYFNQVLVWDEDDDEINSYELFEHLTNLEDIVYSIKFDIVDFHHSIVYLEIEDNG